ncbi:CynX/NimT family MFS transporter [Liquorilactobacillus oeni]|uniref:Major facilitator superfamily (MFS) profile domain-containing protein n=1 Tax=Liquorilactobacillus oeni DSM 19972 TaxID=1423777 RepID=A0A0R1M8E5_9LACO|nr:MFS transporter [Liquorilactobacillus oeni]KRL04431.1 hypothetical protein FD46_GL001560 [Liquorilactobacillus oeni DSM 19972]
MGRKSFNLSWEVFLIAGNLRLAIIVIPPLSMYIIPAFHLTAAQMGILTTIPLICFGMLSIAAPLIIHKFGVHKVLMAALVLLLSANFLRIYSLSLLFLGTILCGIAITLLNVLVPAIIMEYAPKRAGTLNGLYTASLGLWAALVGYFAAFLAEHIGWQLVIQLISLPALIAICGWYFLPKKKPHAQQIPSPVKVSFSQITSRRSQILTLAFYMGLQSFIFYGLVAWLPSILADLKLSVLTIGALLALFQFIGIPISYLVPRISSSLRALKAVLFISFCGYLCGLGLLNTGISSIVLLVIAITCLGLTCSATFSLSLSLITTLAHNAKEASSIGGVVQSIGYLLACFSPTLLGLIKTNVGTWHASLYLMLALSILSFLVGCLFVKTGSTSHKRQL